MLYHVREVLLERAEMNEEPLRSRDFVLPSWYTHRTRRRVFTVQHQGSQLSNALFLNRGPFLCPAPELFYGRGGRHRDRRM